MGINLCFLPLEIATSYIFYFFLSPDVAQVSIVLLRRIPVEKVETWVMFLAAIGGILLLMLLTIGLVKAGFFRREKRDELLKKKREVQNFNYIFFCNINATI